MKKILYTLVICSLLATACRKEDKNETGLATATINGQNFQFITDANLHNNAFSVNFNLYDLHHGLRAEFDLTAMPFKVGTFDIYPFLKKYPSSFLYTAAGDQVLDNYEILESAKNTVTIDKIDQQAQMVSGTFDLYYLIDTAFTVKMDDFPDTIHLANGVFETPYIQL